MLSTSRWWCTTSITDIYEAGFFKLINEAFDTLAYGGHPFNIYPFFWGGMKSLALYFTSDSLHCISEFFFKKKGFVVKHSVSVNEEEGVAAQNIEDCWWRVFCSLKRREEGDKFIKDPNNVDWEEIVDLVVQGKVALLSQKRRRFHHNLHLQEDRRIRNEITAAAANLLPHDQVDRLFMGAEDGFENRNLPLQKWMDQAT